MNTEPQLLEQMRGLIGHPVRHHGQTWLVIDYLSDDQELVLEHLGRRTIQADQHGNGRRRTPETLTIPLYNANGTQHPDFLALNTTVSRP